MQPDYIRIVNGPDVVTNDPKTAMTAIVSYLVKVQICRVLVSSPRSMRGYIL